MNFRSLYRLSIWKTLLFNYKYFSWKGLCRLPVWVSRNFILHTLKGNVTLDDMQAGMIRLGFNEVGIFDRKYDRGIWENTGQIHFKGRAVLGHGSKLSNTGNITFGNNFAITAKSEIVCAKEMEIGDDVLVSWDSLIMDTDFHKIYDEILNKQLNEDAKVTIGNHVWIGCRTVILKGTLIGDNCIVAANSTLSKEFREENVILGGSNKVIKRGVEWRQ